MTTELCTAFCHGCVCALYAAHSTARHECLCGGSWDDEGNVHAWPNENPDTGKTLAEIIADDPVLVHRWEGRPPLPYHDPLLRFGYKEARGPS